MSNTMFYHAFTEGDRPGRAETEAADPRRRCPPMPVCWPAGKEEKEAYAKGVKGSVAL